MPAQRTKVKGIKYGTLAAYNAMQSHDQDMLYFITDKGLLYRGESIVIPVNVTTYTKHDASGANQEYVNFRVETYGNDPENPTVLTFDVYSKTAVNNILSTINTAITNHIDQLATGSNLGHVKLSDATDDTTHDAAYGAQAGATETFAATPKAVALALQAANQYTDEQIAGIAGAMLFKGTLGTADAYSTSIEYAVGDYCTHGSGSNEKLYRCNTATTGNWNASHWTEVARTVGTLPATHTIGWTYRIVAPGTYAGKPCEVGDLVICVESGTAANNDHWTVAQNNIDGAVTADADLDADAFVLGNGGKTVKKMLPGSTGQVMKQGPNGPVWGDPLPADIGNAYGTASPDASGSIFTSNLGGLKVKHGSIVALTFTADVHELAYLTVGDSGPLEIMYNLSGIIDGVINASDTATLMYDGSNQTWVVLAVDRQAPGSLQGFVNDLIMHGTCNTAAANPSKVANISSASAQGMVVAIQFAADVPANATLKLSSGESVAHAIMHRGAAIAANAIRGGDTAMLIYDASSGTGYWHLLAIDRPFDTTPTSGSHNLVDSDAVYQAIENATLYWEEM